jgi:hypothetical protein
MPDRNPTTLNKKVVRKADRVITYYEIELGIILKRQSSLA